MADQTQKKKQPLSLNERHNRILLDLSASQPQRSIRPYPPASAENLEDRLRICKTPLGGNDDDIPGFSGFSDFDSPSPVQSKSPEFKGDGEVLSTVDNKDDSGGSLNLKLQGGCGASSGDNYYEDDIPRFSGIADFDDSPSPDEIKPSKWENECRQEVSAKAESNKSEDRHFFQEHDVPVDIKPSKSETKHRTQISMKAERSDFEDKPALNEPHFPEKKKTVKVKLGGRRRLCKLSSKDDNETKDEEPEMSGLVDFDSPPSSRDAVEKDSCGGDEIRDILNDLTSKFDCLSVEKKRPPKTTESILDSLTERKEEEHDYASATSSFALSSDRSDTSPDSTSVGTSKIALDKEETHIRSDLKVDGNAGMFDGRQNLANRPEKHQTLSKIMLDKEETYTRSDLKVDGNARLFDGRQNLANRPKEHQTTSKIVLDKEETYTRSDFKVDGNARMFDGRQNLANRPKEHQTTSKLVLDKEETYTRSDLKVVGNARMFDGRQNLANRPKEHQTTSKQVLDEEETYIRSDLKVDGSARMFDGRQNLANRQKEHQTKKIGGKSGHVSKATVHNYVHLDEDDDDCLILSGKKGHKGERKYDQLQGIDDDDDDKVDVTEHHNDDFVLVYEKPIISKGSKLTFVLPPKIANMLYAHQRDGMKWLWSIHCQGKGGILGDDMGLGKTMQICGFLAGLFNSRLIKRAMVVAPKTLLPHWIKELSVVGLSGKTREYFGTCAKARQYELQYIFQDKGVLLTTYDIVRNNTKALRGDDYFYGDRSEDEVTWDYMILDEGHLIKNPSTQRAKSLLEIPSAHRIIISGTPIQNNLKELWALFNFCCPELLGDKAWFKERFESAILHGSDKNASDRQKRIGSAAAKELRERIQPHFLRRLKSEVFCDNNATNTASLSKKNELIVWLKLTSCQRQLYEAFLNSEIVLSAFDGSPLAAITILKKICDHPLLLTKRAAEDVLEGMDSMLNQEDSVIAEKLAMHIADVSERSDFGEKHANISCKISFILSLLDNLVSGGHRILIFSQTRKMLNLIQESLITEGYTFLRIDGTSKASDRLKIVNDFQEGAAPIFLLTSQVGGLGLTLTKADRVIVVDPAWNPSTDNQSVDRAYRIGQKKDVIVYRLMTCGTIEEKIYKKQIFKGGLFKTATEHKEQTRYFSQQDLKDMFTLPKHGFDVSITQQQMHQEHDHQHIMDESLKSHIEFLETQGIAGVSHHSLLFSKTAPPPPEGHDDEAERVRETTYVRNSASSSRTELDVDGYEQF